MKKWWKTYILSLRKDLIVLLFVDVSFLLLMYLLGPLLAPYPFFASIGNFFVTLAVALVASIIFFFVQVHMPNVKEKSNLFPSLATLFAAMLGSEKELLTKLIGLKMDEMSEEAINEKTNSINLYANAPLILGGPNGDHTANLAEYCIYEVRRVDNNWEMLMRYSSFLDSECLAILARIQKPGLLLDLVRKMFPMSISPTHGLRFGKGSERTFVDFWRFIQEQENYFNKELAQYMP